MSLTIVLGLVGISPPSIAANRAEPSTKSLPSSAPQSSVPIAQPDVVPQTTCKLALVAQAQDPVAYGTEKIVGRVYNVVGSMVYLELDDGTTTVATLSRWERGRLGNIVGRRIVVTPYDCNRVNLDTTLKWTPAKAIEVPPLTFSNSSPVTPPLTPRPEMTPAPVETPVQAPVETPMPVQQPEVIPQTW